jgi:flagellar FliL protein
MAIKPLPEDEGNSGGAVVESLEGEGKKPNAKKLILFIVLPLLLLAGGGAGAYFTGMLDGLLGKGGEEVAAEDGHGEPAKKDDGHGKAAAGGHGEAGSGSFVQIPNMLVNLTSEGSQQRYLRLSVQIELANAADKAAVEAVMPRVVDQFQTYLRELRVKDLRGSAGIYRLQIELLNRVNAAAYPVEVKDVLFQEILVQ